MTAQTRTNLTTQINSDIPDNSTGDISAEDVRTNLLDSIDSATFPEDLGADIVNVSSLSDFPSPSGNVITLNSNKIYQIHGMIDISPNRINMDGASLLQGTTSTHDGITSTNTGALFTVTSGGIIVINHLSLSGSGSFVSITDPVAGVSAIQNCLIGNFPSGLGTITNPTIFFMSNIVFSNVTGGFTFVAASPPTSTAPLLIMEAMSVVISSGTFIDLGTSLFTNISISSCPVIFVAAGATAISGAASSGNFVNGTGGIINNNFSGDGDYLSGITNTDLRWGFRFNTGNNGTEDSNTFCEVVLERNSVETTITAAGTDGAITGFADAGGGNTTVTSSGAHGLSNGEEVWQFNTTSYNGKFTISNASGSVYDIVRAFVADDATGFWETEWVSMGGTTFEKSSSRANMSGNYEITVDALGTDNLDVNVNMSAHAVGGGTKDLEFAIFVNDVRCFGSLVSLSSTTSSSPLSLMCVEDFTTNDVVEIMARNISDTTNIVIVDVNITLR